MNAPEQPLYERIGGPDAIQEVVDALYARVLADPLLKPFFENVDIVKLRKMQSEFMLAALGGPEKYSGMDLAHAHAGRGIKAIHFSAFVGHLLTVLEERGCSEADLMDVVHRMNLYSTEITGAVSTDG